MTQFEADFDLENDATEEPLVPDGNYRGAITKVAFYEEAQNLKFYITLSDNGGECTDGQTPIDGAVIPYNVWFPRSGDKDEMTASGRQSKWQWKVNNIKKVAEALGINMQNTEAISQGIADSEWVGIEVTVKVGTNEYNNQISNQAESVEAV